MKNVDKLVQDNTGKTVLAGGTTTINLWATGRRYNGSVGAFQAGPVSAPKKAPVLLDNNKLYTRSRPQYEDLGTDRFLVATQHNVKNDGTGDQAGVINVFLQKAASAKAVAYFPAGIYTVGSTLIVPTGSRIQGASWSQIQGSGFFFSDMNNPQVMVRVGNKGDVGQVEVVEMLFTVKGPTAGAILMEWNVQASQPGSGMSTTSPSTLWFFFFFCSACFPGFSLICP